MNLFWVSVFLGRSKPNQGRMKERIFIATAKFKDFKERTKQHEAHTHTRVPCSWKWHVCFSTSFSGLVCFVFFFVSSRNGLARSVVRWKNSPLWDFAGSIPSRPLRHRRCTSSSRSVCACCLSFAQQAPCPERAGAETYVII